MRRAIVKVAGEPNVIEVEEDAPIPELKAGQALIEVAYSPLNPLDTHARANRIAWNHPGFPFVPGFEFCGRVKEVADKENGKLVGQRVACNAQWGGNAEYAVVNADSLDIIPESFDWKLGATYSTCAFTAWHLVNSALSLKAGSTLLVHSAAGAVGGLVMQIAAEKGARVIGLVGSREKLEHVKAYGGGDAVCYTDSDWVSQVKSLTGGKGVNAIVDGNAGPNAVGNYEVVAPLGEIVYLGAMGGKAPPVDISMLIGKAATVKGFVQYFHQAQAAGRDRSEIVDKLTSGTWKIPFGKTFGLDQIVEAHRQFEARDLVGRTLIEVGGESV